MISEFLKALRVELDTYYNHRSVTKFKYGKNDNFVTKLFYQIYDPYLVVRQVYQG